MDKPKRIELKTGVWGYALCAVLVAVRAFSPGSAPMEEWSVWSWSLMLAPVLFPWYLFAACYAAWLCAYALCGTVLLAITAWERLRRLFGRIGKGRRGNDHYPW